MTLTINGETKTFDQAPESIADLLKALGLEGKPVLVEHNGTALFPRQFPTTPLAENDTIKIIQISAGG